MMRAVFLIALSGIVAGCAGHQPPEAPCFAFSAPAAPGDCDFLPLGQAETVDAG